MRIAYFKNRSRILNSGGPKELYLNHVIHRNIIEWVYNWFRVDTGLNKKCINRNTYNFLKKY